MWGCMYDPPRTSLPRAGVFALRLNCDVHNKIVGRILLNELAACVHVGRSVVRFNFGCDCARSERRRLRRAEQAAKKKDEVGEKDVQKTENDDTDPRLYYENRKKYVESLPRNVAYPHKFQVNSGLNPGFLGVSF